MCIRDSPPKTDDRLYSALFPEDPMELMCEVSKIIHSYGMDVWLWYPNVGRDYHDFGCIDREMEERRRVFSAISYLDAMLVPLGDPGSLWPTDAMRLTEHFVEILHEYHPEAGVWVAPQHFQPEPGWYDTFYEEIAKEPDWITGVCFAPWEQDSIEELYEKLPEKYRENIRNLSLIHISGRICMRIRSMRCSIRLTMFCYCLGGTEFIRRSMCWCCFTALHLRLQRIFFWKKQHRADAFRM